MAKSQQSLQAELRELAPRAYFKRLPDNRQCYPCFLYRLSSADVKRADNRAYVITPCYNVIYISQEPSEIIQTEMLEKFCHCSFDREYQADGLYHYSFTLYY